MLIHLQWVLCLAVECNANSFHLSVQSHLCRTVCDDAIVWKFLRHFLIVTLHPCSIGCDSTQDLICDRKSLVWIIIVLLCLLISASRSSFVCHEHNSTVGTVTCNEFLWSEECEFSWMARLLKCLCYVLLQSGNCVQNKFSYRFQNFTAQNGLSSSMSGNRRNLIQTILSYLSVYKRLNKFYLHILYLTCTF